MRFLSAGHLRLGTRPAGIPEFLASDDRAHSPRTALSHIVSTAIQYQVHAVLICGETIASASSGLEPWGPLVDAFAALHQAEIPVIAVPHGEFTNTNLTRFMSSGQTYWLGDTLAWHPPFTTRMEMFNEASVHIVAGTLAETADAPVDHPVTLEQIDHPDSIWLLTDPTQPDAVEGAHALIIEPGAVVPLSMAESGRHGVWLIDTDQRQADLIPIASLEFAAIAIDISTASDLDDVERMVTVALKEAADEARADDSVATTLVIDATIVGANRLYSALGDTFDELQRTLIIEHNDMTIAIARITNDATPAIELAPLLGRPDPVGELARLIHALTSDDELTDSQSRLLTATEQKILAISHARVFGSVLDSEPESDATTLLLRQSWATLDALVRQRGID